MTIYKKLIFIIMFRAYSYVTSKIIMFKNLNSHELHRLGH